MRDHLISFFLGIIIACAALVLQVLFSTLYDIFFGMSYDLSYGNTFTIHTASLLLLGAFSEEIIRYLIMLRYAAHFSHPMHFLTYGVICGSGFGITEIFLRSLDPAQNALSPLVIFPLLIHIITSILLAYGILHFSHTRILRTILLFIAIILHLCGNIALFLFT